MELHNIRDEYTKRVLSQHDCHENPSRNLNGGRKRLFMLKLMSLLQ